MTPMVVSTNRTLRALVLACTVALLLMPSRPAGATGFTDVGDDLASRTEAGVSLHGGFRLRGESLYNLDLDRGLTPSGKPLFPTPASDPTGQSLSHWDMRLRTDVAIYAPGGRVAILPPGTGLAVKLRVDVLDNLSLGSTPDGIPSASTSQRPPEAAFRVKRAYGEFLTPVGLIAAGRMGSHWGLGMLTNGGDCPDCDSGDAADRIAFLTPVFGHIFAVAYDFSAAGPFTARRDANRTVDLDPADNVRTVTVAMLRYKTDLTRERRRRNGKSTVEYGAYVSHRWQKNDAPVSYLPTAQPGQIAGGAGLPSQVIRRDFSATAVDGWFRLSLPRFRLEAEVAGLFASVGQGSLIPGVLYRHPVESRQLGAALQTEYGALDGAFGFGLDAGYASGDPSPGFGAFPGGYGTAPRRGDLDGPQANPPFDYRVDNFRFHPDFRIDRILFREIIGTVTDAIYVRPHLRWRLVKMGRGQLRFDVAAIASFAADPASTPSGKRPLGVEVDPTLSFISGVGFGLHLEYAALFPLSGLDNVAPVLRAQPAQLFRVRMDFLF
jgi:uncharacterized protein (TIGR04551 family)